MDAHSQYRTQAVSTASPVALVGMLYQAAIAAVQRAEGALRADDDSAGESVHRDLVKAQDIVTELAVTLDHERGGEIAGNLAALYDFCLDQLISANVAKDPAPLEGVRSVLGSLAETWAHVEQELATVPPVMAVAG